VFDTTPSIIGFECAPVAASYVKARVNHYPVTQTAKLRSTLAILATICYRCSPRFARLYSLFRTEDSCVRPGRRGPRMTIVSPPPVTMSNAGVGI
jgi:hypothetical protein